MVAGFWGTANFKKQSVETSQRKWEKLLTITGQILGSVTVVSSCVNCNQLLLSGFCFIWVFMFVRVFVCLFLSTVKVHYKLPCSQTDSSSENDLIDIILASKAVHHYGIEPCIVPQQYFLFSSDVIDFW